MPINCTFHHSRAAHFQCHECGTAFCEECISVRKTEGFSGKSLDYFCPACNIPAEMMSLSNIIEPFWNKLGSFFLYPFQLTPLILIIVLAALGTFFPSNIFVNLFVWVVMTKYAYATLIETGQGSLKAPLLTWALINEDVLQVFKQYLIFAVVGFCTMFVFQKGGVIAGGGVLMVIILAMPAILMLLVATNSVLHALNPMLFIGIMSRIGLPYFLMYLFLFFLLAGPTTLFAYLPSDVFPLQVYIFVTLFLKQFYALICYHLLGYVLLQYHKEIGYDVDYEFFMEHRGGKRQRKKQTPEDELNRGVAILIKQGKYEQALEELHPHIKKEKPLLEISEKFFQLLKMAGKTEDASRYAVRHLDLLVGEEKKQKALTLFAEIKTDGETVQNPDTVFKIAAWFLERNEFRQAMSMYVYFIKQFKNHSRQPEVYFELAQILHERGNNSAKAQHVLEVLIKSYPKHDLVPRVRDYLTLIAKTT